MVVKNIMCGWWQKTVMVVAATLTKTKSKPKPVSSSKCSSKCSSKRSSKQMFKDMMCSEEEEEEEEEALSEVSGLSELSEDEVDRSDEEVSNGVNELLVADDSMDYDDVLIEMWVVVKYEGEKFIGNVDDKKNGEISVQCLEKPFRIREPQSYENYVNYLHYLHRQIFVNILHTIYYTHCFPTPMQNATGNGIASEAKLEANVLQNTITVTANVWGSRFICMNFVNYIILLF